MQSDSEIKVKIASAYGKNSFAEMSKNSDTNLKIILLNHQNNYAER